MIRVNVLGTSMSFLKTSRFSNGELFHSLRASGQPIQRPRYGYLYLSSPWATLVSCVLPPKHLGTILRKGKPPCKRLKIRARITGKQIPRGGLPSNS